ncbi:hypothetical protein B0H11DRAFT_1161430 [Mycena galericulata]|nr:hypothetical protein B0H11DRAFT_1161430 [Mycena galericulata]
MFILVCEASDLSDYSWVGCSHVCSSWRAISLDMPHLWSHVVFSASEWTRVCIQRSKSALLVIDADLSIPWVEDRVCEVLKLADRVGSINIQFFALSSQATKLLGGPFPMLRSFSMDISNFLVPPNFNLAMNPNMEPYPRLRNLQVHSNVAFLPPLPTRLVSLEIDNRAAVNVGWDGFAAALRLLAELEVLTLHGFPIPLISASRLTDRIPLPNLREIHLWGSPPDCTRILEAMDCPQIEKYDIHLYTVHDLRDMFRTVLGNLGRPPPKSMFLHRQYGTLTTDFFRNPFLDIGFYQHAVFGLAYADTRDLDS